MTFSALETSTSDGRPIELFQFAYSGNTWLFTSADRAIEYNFQTFEPIPISRSEIASSSDTAKSNITIEVSLSSGLGELFRVQPPSEPVTVTVFGSHYLDGQLITVFKGRVSNASIVNSNMVELTCDSVFTSLTRPGLRRTFQTQCPFALYGASCGVSRSAFQITGTVSTVSGLTLTVPACAGKIDNWFAGGYVTWLNASSGNVEKRMIRSSSGQTIVLASQPIGLVSGMQINAFAGCDHTINGSNGCAEKFANHVRFGGTPWQPTKNPFGGSTIY